MNFTPWTLLAGHWLREMMEVIFLEIGDFSESTCVSVTKTLKAAQSFKWYNNEGFVRASML